jgi:UDP-N-acetylglucosamine diphosphorylase/glucosamine-1-phosphate N-acetyltransferase
MATADASRHPHSISSHAKVAAVILAAGKGTRMESDLAKVLHPLAGRPLIAHVLETCRALSLACSVVVVGYQRERVEQAAASWGARFALQDRQLGTGHAVLSAESAIRSEPGVATVLVLCGDCPMVPVSLLERVLQKHQSSAAACTAVGARLPDAGRYGRMITDAAGRLARIVEYKDASDSERAVRLINSGIYAFSADELFRSLKRITPNNAQGEYYLTDVVAMLVAQGKLVELVETEDAAAVMGINTPQELATAERIMGVASAHGARPGA